VRGVSCSLGVNNQSTDVGNIVGETKIGTLVLDNCQRCATKTVGLQQGK